MQSGEYDGVSASGDATTRLIAGGEVSPVNVDLIPNYADVFEDLKLQQHNSVDGVPYGVPHGRGANLLVFNTEAFADGAPDSWGVMFDGGTPADGAVSVYDSPIYIADAARVPDGDATGPRHHQPVRPRPGAVRRGDRPARAAAGPRRAVLVAVHGPAGGARGRHRAGRHDLAGHRQPGAGQRCLDRRRQAGRGGHRVVRHLDDRVRGGPPELHVHVDGLDHLPGGQRGRSPSGSARRRPTPRAATSPPRVTARRSTPTTPPTGRTSTTGRTATEECLDGRTDVTCVPYTEWVNAWNALRS